MIPTNLITGFLGVGKTTLIRHLLRQHAPGERWAVLVNEFGEIGVDGTLIADEGVAVEEVAGGCLCCVAAPAFTVGLNRLIREQRPNRILIEPSGLGHPAQVLETLRSPMYRQVLQLQATLCVIDARHLGSVRHREHPSFLDQIHLADVLVANKADCYSPADESALLDFAAGIQPPKTAFLFTERGQIDVGLLDLPGEHRQATFPEAHAFLLANQPTPETVPVNRWVCMPGQHDGFFRVSWLCPADAVFDKQALLACLDAIPAARVKGVFLGDGGAFSYNRSDDAREVTDITPPGASRLQVFDSHPLDHRQLDTDFRACRVWMVDPT